MNRIDETVIFKSLDKLALSEIVDLELAKVEKRLLDKNIKIRIAAKVKKHLAEKGFDITFGARPLKRIIQNTILDELALDIIEGKVKEGDNITIDLGVNHKLMLKVK